MAGGAMSAPKEAGENGEPSTTLLVLRNNLRPMIKRETLCYRKCIRMAWQKTCIMLLPVTNTTLSNQYHANAPGIPDLSAETQNRSKSPIDPLA
jgi:hypothetical protein